MRAVPSPRRWGFQVSLKRTIPAPHSPPRPTPTMKRNTTSAEKFHANAELTEATANTTRVHCNAALRPIRSPSQPNTPPPSTEPISVIVVMLAASPSVMRIEC